MNSLVQQVPSPSNRPSGHLRGRFWSRRSTWILATLASIAVAIASYRYVIGVGPMPPKIVANVFASPWLPLHAAAAATSLLIGPFQFLPRLRSARPALHRWTGRVYAVTCLFGAVSGLILALGTTMGPVAMAGFGSLSVIWAFTIGYGWQRAREHRFPDHRRWMIRSWVLTFAAVNLRVYLSIAGVFGIPFDLSYPIISFLAWVPNLILAELYLARTDRPKRQTQRLLLDQVS